MDATLTSLDTRELAALRRRAYGPAADIAGDPVAQRRLDELEERSRAYHLAYARRAVVPAAFDDELGEPMDAAPTPSTPAGLVASIPPHETEEAPTPIPRPRWLRPIAWIAIAAIVLAGALVAPRIADLVGARPDATLVPIVPNARDTTVDSLTPDQARAYFSIDTDSLLKYESFHGVEVWVAQSDLGSRCLLLLAQASLLGISCTPGGLDPSIDLTMFGGREEMLGSGLSVGSVVRFVSHPDRVEVWISEAAESA